MSTGAGSCYPICAGAAPPPWWRSLTWTQAGSGFAEEALQLPPSRCYTSVEGALVDNDCDFVIVVVPPAAHEEVIDAAIARGHHILCEKPLADSFAACLRISEQVRRAGLKMAVTMSHRWDRDKQSLQSAVQSGSYGTLNTLSIASAELPRLRVMGRLPPQNAGPVACRGLCSSL